MKCHIVFVLLVTKEYTVRQVVYSSIPPDRTIYVQLSLGKD
jgi:hypothetical protein